MLHKPNQVAEMSWWNDVCEKGLKIWKILHKYKVLKLPRDCLDFPIHFKAKIITVARDPHVDSSQKV